MHVIKECYTNAKNTRHRTLQDTQECYTFSYVDAINVDMQIEEKLTYLEVVWGYEKKMGEGYDCWHTAFKYENTHNTWIIK